MSHTQYGKRAGGCKRENAIYENATRQKKSRNGRKGGHVTHTKGSPDACSKCSHYKYACNCIDAGHKPIFVAGGMCH